MNVSADGNCGYHVFMKGLIHLGKGHYLKSGKIVASNFSIHDEILKNINIKF